MDDMGSDDAGAGGDMVDPSLMVGDDMGAALGMGGGGPWNWFWKPS